MLSATKHEDDKVGRFLGALAFLVAGALLFVQQTDVMDAEYDLGVLLPLPAISLSLFLLFVTLAVLLYVLGIAMPVTPPPSSEAATPRGHSKLFFLEIAQETRDTWENRWKRKPDALQRDLVKQYREETLNLAYRAYVKRNRSTEASVFFQVALLFFGLTMGFAVHAASATPVSAGGEIYSWTYDLQLPVAAGLAVFASLIVYTQFAAVAVRRIGNRESEALGGLYVVMVAVALLIGLLVLVPPEASEGWRVAAAIAAFVTAGAMAAGWSTSRRKQPSALFIVVALLFAASAAASFWLTPPAVQLLVAVLAAGSPLSWQFVRSVRDLQDLRAARRANRQETGML